MSVTQCLLAKCLSPKLWLAKCLPAKCFSTEKGGANLSSGSQAKSYKSCEEVISSWGTNPFFVQHSILSNKLECSLGAATSALF
jgi:hypothetical protein